MLQRKIESLARSDNANVLSTVVDITDQAIKSWAKEEKAQAMIWANSPDLRNYVLEILKVPKRPYD